MKDNLLLDIYIALLYRECEGRYGTADLDKDERAKAFVDGFVLGMDLGWLPSARVWHGLSR